MYRFSSIVLIQLTLALQRLETTSRINQKGSCRAAMVVFKLNSAEQKHVSEIRMDS